MTPGLILSPLRSGVGSLPPSRVYGLKTERDVLSDQP